MIVDISAVLANYYYLLLFILFSLTLFFVFYKLWKSNYLWLLGQTYTVPFFGKLNQLANNKSFGGEWFLSEKEVCSHYKPYYQSVLSSKKMFLECRNYLSAVGESDRKPLSIWVGIGLFGILFFEAWVFSYTMSGFIDFTASEDTRQMMAYILALGFAVTLALVTHNMGREIHRNRIIDSIREHWMADKSPDRPDVLIQQTTALESPQDTHEPLYQQRLNRLQLGKPTKCYNWTFVTIILVGAIACFLTYIRFQALEVAIVHDQICELASPGNTSMPSFGLNSTSINDVIRDIAPQGLLDTELHACQAQKAGSWATFAVLAVLFCMLQWFATYISTIHGFAGARSKDAYEMTRKFKMTSEFREYHDKKLRYVVTCAQKTLKALQIKMNSNMRDTDEYNLVGHLLVSSDDRTFMEYLKIESLEDSINPKNSSLPPPLSNVLQLYPDSAQSIQNYDIEEEGI